MWKRTSKFLRIRDTWRKGYVNKFTTSITKKKIRALIWSFLNIGKFTRYKSIFSFRNCSGKFLWIWNEDQRFNILKTGEKIQVSCPSQIKCYLEIMGGVDLSDQINVGSLWFRQMVEKNILPFDNEHMDYIPIQGKKEH